MFLNSKSPQAYERTTKRTSGLFSIGDGDGGAYGDSGSAARFFYCAKASRAEREMGCDEIPDRTKRIFGDGIISADHPDIASGGGDRQARNYHPTVKPIALMRYVCRLITPPDGLVFDPFMGSGSTGIAARLEGFRFLGCEIDPEYHVIAEARIRAAIGESVEEIDRDNGNHMRSLIQLELI